VDVVELLGAELHLIVNSGKNSFVATVDPRMDVHMGNEIDLVLDMSAAHLFDKNTERAIR
jgi:multiple sugar transport system ATP-binding protein